jgi:predicted ATPase
MKIGLLGSLEVLDGDGGIRAVPGTRLQALLVVLALRCGDVVHDDILVDALWGAQGPARTVNALQRQVSTLRRVLGGPHLVERRAPGYALALDRDAIDIFRFDNLAARGHEAMRDGDVAGASELLHQALQLWRGDALADVAYQQFAQAEISRLAEARMVAVEARVDADLALGRDAALISELEQLVLAHPLREHLRAQLMLALARSGRQADALRSFQDARLVLGEELGLEPSRELRDLERAILLQDDAIVRPEAELASPLPRTNVPVPLTTMVGRHHEMDTLRPLLDAQRLVTLVGPGGVGKSRLAVEAAREWIESHHVDVWLVELAEIVSPDEIVPAIMTALDLPRSANTASDMKRLVEFLKDHRAVVVLDNCEHVVAAAARIAQDLLESCAGLKIWTTSREGLGITSEVLWPVQPLPLDDAVALFVERGRAADPTFDFGDSSHGGRDALERLCSRLDGLPLAIELAAARLRAMTIAELLSGLEDRFRLLNRGARTALPRQQTLRAVVDWSYTLLFDDERSVFERLSVFGGGCSFAAARVVCADDDITSDDVAELVTRLAEKSLLSIEKDEVEGYARCRMLQTLVDYGRERLEASGDAERVYDAHVRYYADLSARSLVALRGEKQRGWIRSVTANLANLRFAFDAARDDNDAETAYRIAGCLGWYWWFTGRALEGAQWLALAQSCDGPVEDLTRARLLAWTAFTRAPGFVQWAEPDHPVPAEGDPGRHGESVGPTMEQLTTRALAVYREVGAFAELAGVEAALASAYAKRGDHAQARALLVDAQHHLSNLERDNWAGAMHAFVTGQRALAENRYVDAEAAFRTSIDLLEVEGSDAYRMIGLRYVGRLAELRGDHAAGIEAADRALHLARHLGLTAFANVLMTDLGAALAAHGEFGRAREILERSLRAARDVGYLPGIGECLAAIAVVEWRADHVERAARLALEALPVVRGAGNLEATAQCFAVLGYVSERDGDLAGARTRHTRSREIALEHDAPHVVALALEGIAGVEQLEGDGSRALELLGAAHALRQSPGLADGWAFASTRRGDIDRIVADVTETIGTEAASRAFSVGADDPDATIARTAPAS